MEEQFLAEIGRDAREDDAEERRRFDERLRRLAAGELSAEEEAEMRAAAETSEEARLDYEAFRPLDADFHARMTNAWQARTANADAASKVVPIDRARQWARLSPSGPWMALAAVLVLTVAGLFFLREPAFDLPTYIAEFEGQRRDVRSGETADDELPVFAMGGDFLLRLRPQREAAVDPQLAFFLAPGSGADGELRKWDVDRRISAAGVVTIEGTLDEDLWMAPGDWTFVMLYGRPGSLPGPGTLGDLEDGTRAWRAVSVAFRVLAATAIRELPLEVLYAGCYALRPGPVCVPYPELTFWVRSAPEAELEARRGGKSFPLHFDENDVVDGGLRFTLPVTAADGAVEIRAQTGGREARFRLPLAKNDEPEWFKAARRRAAVTYQQADAEGAAVLREELDSGLRNASPELQGSILSLLARLEGTEKKDAVAYLEKALELHRRSGRLLELAHDRARLLSWNVHGRDFERLEEELRTFTDELPPDAPGEAAFHLHYYRGILESDRGNYPAALAALELAVALGRRLDLSRDQTFADARMAFVLHSLGRSQEAAERFDRLDMSGLVPCDGARLYNNHAWFLTQTDDNFGDPLTPLDAALNLAESAKCGVDLWLDLRLNQAVVYEQRGRAWEARQALAAAEKLVEDASERHRLWREDVKGRFALATGRGANALEHYLGMGRHAEKAFTPWSRLRAKLGQAAAHELLGATEDAVEAYAAAEDLLDGRSLQVPLDAGRESFVADGRAGTRHYLALLLAEGRVAEALALARRSRSRVLASIRRGHRLAHLRPDQRPAWDHEISRYLELRDELELELDEEQLAQSLARRDELRRAAHRALDRAFRVLGDSAMSGPLPALRHGELVLAYHPLPAGWVGFAGRPGRVDVHRFELEPDVLDDPQQLAGRLLEPFGAAIAESSRIRVLAYGALREVDFHALPWDGGVLLGARPVVYGLDLGTSPAAAAPWGEWHALVIGDPRGDLPAAAIEADKVEKALRRHPAFSGVTRLGKDSVPSGGSKGGKDSVPSGGSKGGKDSVPLGGSKGGKDSVPLGGSKGGKDSVSPPGSPQGDSATLDATRRHLAGVDLAHVAGHGVIGGRFGWESALLLAGNDHLTVGDILALERAPAQVVLSSCVGAESAATPVEGLGLAQAFLVAGSRNVIAALRVVDDRDTTALFEEVYAPWDDSTSLADRLRAAQLVWYERAPGADWASFRILEP